MTMRRLIMIIVLAVMPFLMVLPGCAPEQPSTAPLDRADVTMISCLPSFVGAESICLTPLFSISNPNDFTIGLDLEYGLKVEGRLVGKSQLPRVYVPSGETIQVKDTIVVPFMGWLAGEAMGGKGIGGAMMVVAPLWKGLGGKRPAVAPEALWDTLEISKPAIVADASIIVSTETSQKVLRVSSRWQESE